jgi:hypothetical protein
MSITTYTIAPDKKGGLAVQIDYGPTLGVSWTPGFKTEEEARTWIAGHGEADPKIICK